MEKSEIIQKIKDSEHQKIKFAIPDIDGILRGKTIHKKKFLDVAEKSIGFCDVVFGWDANDVCYDNVKVTGWHSGYPDAQARIDLSTLRNIPWDNQTPFFLADFSKENEAGLPSCSRNLLKKIKAEADQMGFRSMFSQEFEWFNFLGKPNDLAESGYTKLKPITPGMFGYSLLRPSEYPEYFNEIFDMLAAFDVPLEGMHTETGPGVYEAAILYDDILAAADKAALFKTGVKEIAYRHGIVATFMAKWNDELPGCGGHLHQSLWDKATNQNLFLSDEEGNMNVTMESYLAGVLHCLPEIMPMYVPNINSYKRLREGAWAPTNITWGKDNRTATVRVINGDEKSARLEMRVTGADTNPYLAMGACLASGLYGIKKNLKLNIQETIGNAYEQKESKNLPSNLLEASRIMRDSKIANELFGEAFVDHFINTREWEWREFSKAVTDWEIKRYFEII